MAAFEDGRAPVDSRAPGSTVFHERRPEENFEEVCEYLPGQPGADVCPSGLRPLSKSECQDMPYFYGGAYDESVQAAGPVGCYFSGGQYRFSEGGVPLEQGSEQVPYCKHCELVSMDEVADWTTWSPETAPKVSSRFRKVPVGTCQDVGWEPIPDEESCQDATRELGLAWEEDEVAEVHVSTVAERPEGCYQLTDYEAQKQTVWFNTNPYSEGFGAETGEPRVGLLRQPVCQRSGAEAADLDAWLEFYPAAEDLAASEEEASTTAAVTTTAKPQRFRRLLTGSCASSGGKPVASVETCESAAKELGLPSFTAVVRPMPDRPEGCYLERRRGDTTAALWLNSDPEAAGKGAETSEGGTTRSPICEML